MKNTEGRKKKTSADGDGMFAEVAIAVPIRRTFTYRIPAEMVERAKEGARALVPFGKRILTGYLTEVGCKPAEDLDPGSIKSVSEIIDDEPMITPEMLKLTKWTADYYAASWGEILKASLPAGINTSIEHIVTATHEGRIAAEENSANKAAKWRILELVVRESEMTQKDLVIEFGATVVPRALRELGGAGLVTVAHRALGPQTKEKQRKAVRLLMSETPEGGKALTPQQRSTIEAVANAGGDILFTDLVECSDAGASTVNTLAKHGYLEIYVREVMRDPLKDARIPKRKEIELTKDQTKVLGSINKAVNSGEFKAFLLHGVTGSGKTEVYIRAMQEALGKGRSSLMLVPEIALTPVFSRRLKSVFGSDVAILHSSLSHGERFDEWRRIRSGEAKIVIGTRSAVFAPLQNIGIVIVDEEHDGSYRQQESPFYSARDIAVVRASFAKGVAILGSATPAMETYHNAQAGKYEYLQLPNRVNDRPMANAEIVDMRLVFKSVGKDDPISPQLAEAIGETHARGEQSMIFLNRRGFSQFVLCRSCGDSMRCDNCDITLTYHKKQRTLVCHYCNHIQRVPDLCPKCGSEYLYFIGEGTEQIEDQLQERFPSMRIARIDRDTIQRRNELEDILERFSNGEIDMLVGTQMIAKGHDFHKVTLVGVISVDTALGLPDFRAAERTFQLLTQVAGRAGRGELKGRVLIQTYYPEHYVIRHACAQDYEGFYAEEIDFRNKLAYPPFAAVASLLIKHHSYEYAMENARVLSLCLQGRNKERHCRVLGPAPAPLSRLRNEHRIQILIKSPSRAHLRKTLDAALADAEAKKCDMRIVSVEIDPVNLL